MSLKTGIPKLSKKKIIELSEIWIDSIKVNLFENTYLDLERVFLYLQSYEKLAYYERPLGVIDNKKILGLMVPKQNTIYIDTSLNLNISMKRFTQAHELAHWILHRNLDLSDYTLEDTHESLNQQRTLISTYDWIEWQANTYAAFLLMPKTIFMSTMSSILSKLNFPNKFTQLSPYQLSKVIKVLSFKFQVSQTSVMIHVNSLKHLF